MTAKWQNLDSQTVQEHFSRPRNVGEVPDSDAASQVGSLTCGAQLRLTLKVDSTQRITECRFKAAGCSLLVASCSLLTEAVKGLTTAEAAVFAQLPTRFASSEDKEHCQSLAAESLLTGIRSYSDSVRAEWSGDDALICTCFGVSERTIEEVVRARGLSEIEQVTEACNAGGGCRSCYTLIQDILDDCKLRLGNK